ncbi:MAG: HAD-IC family P-type ATPase, partial [Oscillospiraceae bacterium]|nr:HAD-IC family P-type ATPase [Oscillospiraceae bacterium]
MARVFKKSENSLNSVLPRIEAAPEVGLTSKQARERLENGYANETPETATKTVGQIIVSNLFTYFNLIFCVLAVFILLVGSYNDLMFLPVVFVNAAIGIIQELRSKKVTDKLSLVNAPKAVLVRDGKLVTMATNEAVRDDIAYFTAGNQIYADAVVLEGAVQVNEALVTGEQDEITKLPGDTLLSGSFIISGECAARLEKVGAESFVSQLTNEAKKHKKKKSSEMLSSLNRLLKIIGILIIPLGIIMFIQQTQILGRTVKEGVVSTVGALIGMIPEGLFLLVSVALVVSIMRLAQKKTLVHEMGCIETLARVDVLCVDKTGTITESEMNVRGTVSVNEAYDEEKIGAIMADYIGCMGGDNDTMAAMRRYFTGEPKRKAQTVMQFSSSVKYGGVSFVGGETYLLGAPEMILLGDYDTYRETIEPYSAEGCRVLLLAKYYGDLEKKGINGKAEPVALVLLTNRIRPDAPPTFAFFKKQGVKIMVISGDNPVTVSRVAMEAGIDDADKYIDANLLTTERKIKKAIQEYTVFGRVTPEKKRKLVQALKKAGHIVAMTGDGVNDILAMKDADCSIAMASGSEVASQVAQLVLMDSKFSSMPSVVMEGRRVINNIERSASLFLVKNMFSFLLSIVTLLFALTYPLAPSQLTLVNMTTIGIPSFILAMEFNK